MAHEPEVIYDISHLTGIGEAPAMPVPPPGQPTTMTAHQLAAYWQVSLRTIRTLYATGKLPKPERVGRSLRWRTEDIQRTPPPRKGS